MLGAGLVQSDGCKLSARVGAEVGECEWREDTRVPLFRQRCVLYRTQLDCAGIAGSIRDLLIGLRLAKHFRHVSNPHEIKISLGALIFSNIYFLNSSMNWKNNKIITQILYAF